MKMGTEFIILIKNTTDKKRYNIDAFEYGYWSGYTYGNNPVRFGTTPMAAKVYKSMEDATEHCSDLKTIFESDGLKFTPHDKVLLP